MESAWEMLVLLVKVHNEINRMLSVGMLIKKSMKGHVDLLDQLLKYKKN
jgi:hypothetical protein